MSLSRLLGGGIYRFSFISANVYIWITILRITLALSIFHYKENPKTVSHLKGFLYVSKEIHIEYNVPIEPPTLMKT